MQIDEGTHHHSDTLVAHRQYLDRCRRPTDRLPLRLLSAKWSSTIKADATVLTVLSYASTQVEHESCTVSQWIGILDAMFHVDPSTKGALLAIDGQLVRSLALTLVILPSSPSVNPDHPQPNIGPLHFDALLAESDLPLSTDSSVVLPALERRFGCTCPLLRLVLLERWYDYEALFAHLPTHLAGTIVSNDVLEHFDRLACATGPLVYVRRDPTLTFDALVSALQMKFDSRRRR